MNLTLHAIDWLHLALHFLSLSLLAVGGAITTTPEMHRYLVTQQGWLTDGQFSASIALAQAAPGPNVLFVALMGWQVGLNAADASGAPWAWLPGLFGALLTLTALLVPSTLLNYAATQWAWRNRNRRAVRAFKQGMAPVVVALLIATAWVLGSSHSEPSTDWPLWLLTVVSAWLVWKTRLHLLWLLAAGALLGAFGLV